MGVRARDRLVAIARPDGGVTAALQPNAEQLGDVGIVVDDQNMAISFFPIVLHEPVCRLQRLAMVSVVS